jgi:hypothetical protein
MIRELKNYEIVLDAATTTGSDNDVRENDFFQKNIFCRNRNHKIYII